jgi:hypothetical protein
MKDSVKKVIIAVIAVIFVVCGVFFVLNVVNAEDTAIVGADNGNSTIVNAT